MTDDRPSEPSTGQPLHIGVDVGGTFTDVFAIDRATGAVHTTKVPSTPSMPATGVIRGLEQLLARTGYEAGDVGAISHGSTVTINAVIERDGARTAAILTDGYDAIPVAGTGARPQSEVKNPRYVPPEPLVPQRRVRGVPERIDADGQSLVPLDEDAVRAIVGEFREAGVDSIAVCLLFSFLDPDHEARVAALIREAHPDCWVSLSSAVSPRIREYPRLATTIADAYVGPLLDRYLAHLTDALVDNGFDPGELTMMFSHGGLGGFDEASHTPVYTMLSGPTAGVQGALFVAGLVGVDDVITMDMGGTSCDIAIAPGGEPVTTTEKAIGGHPVSVPMVDVQAIGAGGGTVARVDAGRLTVGPDSAGAEPGPICYGRGGTEITVTDANAYLGRLNPDSILGGELTIDLDAVEAALDDQIASPLGLTVVEAAAGILEVVNDKMKKEFSVALTEHGCDPRTFSLVAYGGAGPMHAVPIARELAIDRVIVPSWPGLNSAVGLLTADRKRLYERSSVEPLDEAPLDDRFRALESEARSNDGGSAARVTRELELRYAGQSYELSVPVTADDTPETIRRKFTERHRERFGHVSDEPLETMTYRVTATGTGDRIEQAELAAGTDRSGGDPSARTARRVYFDGSYRDTPVFDRGDLPAGARFDGPAIIEQLDSTVVVEPRATVEIDGFGNLVLTDLDRPPGGVRD